MVCGSCVRHSGHVSLRRHAAASVPLIPRNADAAAVFVQDFRGRSPAGFRGRPTKPQLPHWLVLRRRRKPIVQPAVIRQFTAVSARAGTGPHARRLGAPDHAPAAAGRASLAGRHVDLLCAAHLPGVVRPPQSHCRGHYHDVRALAARKPGVYLWARDAGHRHGRAAVPGPGQAAPLPPPFALHLHGPRQVQDPCDGCHDLACFSPRGSPADHQPHECAVHPREQRHLSLPQAFHDCWSRVAQGPVVGRANRRGQLDPPG
mmetsp:Transcript_4448/g.10470  ORF Transcript_4448/g.10470 Transcript_4448/m.10470 type:complete len:260 (-) Transcript_4448:1242-2021(-)